jgi:hypothetical protein
MPRSEPGWNARMGREPPLTVPAIFARPRAFLPSFQCFPRARDIGIAMVMALRLMTSLRPGIIANTKLSIPSATCGKIDKTNTSRPFSQFIRCISYLSSRTCPSFQFDNQALYINNVAMFRVRGKQKHLLNHSIIRNIKFALSPKLYEFTKRRNN